MAEGVGVGQCHLDPHELYGIRNRSRVSLIPLEDGILEDYAVSNQYLPS